MTPAEQRVLNQVASNLIQAMLTVEQLRDENAALKAELEKAVKK